MTCSPDRLSVVLPLVIIFSDLSTKVAEETNLESRDWTPILEMKRSRAGRRVQSLLPRESLWNLAPSSQ